MELCNAYTELNNPREQRERFNMQEEENNLIGIETQQRFSTHFFKLFRSI
jgi:lysyl-tRNA synthetase class II